MYGFPPFFTKQPNVDTEAKRVQLWRDLILSYCAYHKIFSLRLNESTIASNLFQNQSISRGLGKADILDIFRKLVSAGLCESVPEDQEQYLIFWRRPSEWADIIFSWVVSRGYTDSVMTMYEFREASMRSSEGREFLPCTSTMQ